MFSVPLLSSDNKLVQVSLDYTDNANFFKLYESSQLSKKDSIEVPFSSEALNYIEEKDVPIELVREVLSIHDYFDSPNHYRLMRYLTRRWIIEGFNPVSHQLISEWIVDHRRIATIVRFHECHNIFPISYDVIDNDVFWHNIQQGITNTSMLEVLEFAGLTRRPISSSRVIPLWIKYMNDNWSNRILHNLMKYCKNPILRAIHRGITIGRDTTNLIAENDGDLEVIWNAIGRTINLEDIDVGVIKRLIGSHTLLSVITGIVLSHNLELCKILINIQPESIDRIARIMSRRGTRDMVEYARSLNVSELKIEMLSKYNYFYRTDDSALTPESAKDLIDRGDPITEEMWKKVRDIDISIKDIIYHIIANNKLEYLRTFPLKMLYRTPLLARRVKELLTSQ